jgi:hypothetical protein
VNALKVSRYVECRVDAYKSLFSPPFDEQKWNEFWEQADAIWQKLTDEEKREAERGYFAGVQAFNKGYVLPNGKVL